MSSYTIRWNDEVRDDMPVGFFITTDRGWTPVNGDVFATDQECQKAIDILSNKVEAPIVNYRTVNSSVYGEGRVYADRPGATYYKGSSGKFNVQIWDN